MNLKIISAGAGSGKTYSLTQEMTELLSPDDSGKAAVRASGIIATTFTNKAAAELKERVRVKLLEEGFSQEADELANAMIGTVHAIGVQLLKRFAFEAGVSPEVDIIADGDHQTIFNQSIATVLDLDTIKEMEGLAERLGFQKSFRNRKDWRADLRQLTDMARANNFDEAVLRKSQRYSVESFMDLLPKVSKRTAEQFDDDLLRILGNTIHALEGNDDGTKTKQSTLRTLRNMRTDLKNKGQLNWYDWAKLSKLKTSKKSKEDVEELIEFATEHPRHPNFQADIKRYISRSFELAIAALNEYEQYKKTRGLIDYIDMEVLILKLLDNPMVLEVLQDEIDLLLVDEFQDTNPIQLKIFLKLSKIAKQAIWVGDPKQSIYGFRGAAPELMDAVVNLAEENNNVSVLGNSWRSRQDLVDSVNAIFVRAFDNMPEERIALDTAPPFVKEKESPKLGTALHHWHLDFEGNRKPGKPWAEKCIALNIRRLLEKDMYVRIKGSNEVRPLRAGDIAVLCRSNHACQTVAEALHDQGLKASISRSGLLQTPEAALVLACLKYLLNEHDSLAVAEIMLLAASNNAEEVIEDRLQYLHEKDKDRKIKWGNQTSYIQQLNTLRNQVRELSATEILNLVIEKLDLMRVVAAWSNEQQRFDNVDALRSLALQYEETCNRLHTAATLGGFLLWLNELARESMDQQGTGAGSDAVNVLTYHKSKGLEWPVVICHSLGNKLRDNIWGIRTISESDEVNLDDPLANRLLCYWINPYSDQSRSTALMDTIEQHPAQEASRKAALAEEARLLYVGLTRARDYLVLPSIRKVPTKWLNRVYHHGQENIPTLDPMATEAMWSWKGNEIPMQTYSEVYPKNFPSVESKAQPIYYLNLPKGEQSHYPAQIEHPKMLFPNVQVQASAQFDRFGEAFELSEEIEEKHDYATLAGIFGAFMRADKPKAQSENQRLQMAHQLLQQYNLDELIKPQVLLQYAQDFYQYLHEQYQPKHIHQNQAFLYQQPPHRYSGMIDFWVETQQKTYLAVKYTNLSLNPKDKKLSPAQQDEAYQLYAAAQALGNEKLTADQVDFLLLFPLAGKLAKLSTTKVAK